MAKIGKGLEVLVKPLAVIGLAVFLDFNAGGGILMVRALE